jgi:hypothetical protein
MLLPTRLLQQQLLLLRLPVVTLLDADAVTPAAG